jgi:aspartate/methionine/tyrosine aminotransferase
MSKTYAITGLRLGYIAIKDPKIRERAKKVVFCTTSNVSSLVQYGAVGALQGSQDVIEDFRKELTFRRELFYSKLPQASKGILSGTPPAGAFYGFVKIDPSWKSPLPNASESQSWAMTEFLIKKARIGSVPGVDFGSRGEGHLRFCFARDRKEIEGALESMAACL